VKKMETALKEQTARPRTFIDEICEIPGGEGIRLCMQCGTCTASCPNAEHMEHTPAQLIAMARAGLKKEVLSSDAPWYCMSCYMCTVRCPRGVKVTDLMHAFESMAVKEGLSNKKSTTPIMYKSFNTFVSSRGRLSELWLMVWFYMRTNPFKAIKMLPVALDMFTHNRISLKMGKVSPEGIKQLKAIINKAESLGGAK
jgi:heterodisulfide reductase subunit C